MEKLFVFTKITGIVMLAVGIIINYIISRRRFYRRSITGMQVFKTYEHAWVTRWIERIGKLIAFLLIIGGLILFIGSFLPIPGTK